MAKYIKTFQIPYYDSDKYGNATTSSILAYLGETSGEHTDSIGFGFNKLKELNYAWMLNKWKVRIDRYPKAKEKITIETWASGMDRFYATREFVIYDEENKELCRASTLWIFIDMNKKRPIRIPLEIVQSLDISEERVFNEFYDFKKEINIDKYIDFHVRRSDIDYNNHVNNTKYLSWMLETVPEYIHENYILNEFEILYKKETTYGNTILSGTKEINEIQTNKEFIHNILDKDNNEIHAFAITRWKKIE